MQVSVEHFHDVGIGPGGSDYEGDYITFTDGTAVLKGRTYTDTPAEASLVATAAELQASPLTTDAVQYLLDRGAKTIKYLGPSGAYETWANAG